MRTAVRDVLEATPGVAYALLFGSQARGSAHARSDVDVAIGVPRGQEPSALALGDLISRLEHATGRDVSLVIVHEAPIPLAFRIFREGVEILVRDRRVLVEQKALAIIRYLDFKPLHECCVAGALRAASRG